MEKISEEHEVTESINGSEPVSAAPQDALPAKPKASRSIVGIIVLIALLAGGGYLLLQSRKSPQPQQASESETTQANPQTILTVSGDTATVDSDSISVPILITTGENMVSAVELHLGFDPAVLTGVTVEPGDFFTDETILQQVNTQEGTATFILGTRSPRTGSGTVAVFKASVAAQTGGEITIRLLDTTQAAAIGQDGNVVSDTQSRPVAAP